MFTLSRIYLCILSFIFFVSWSAHVSANQDHSFKIAQTGHKAEGSGGKIKSHSGNHHGKEYNQYGRHGKSGHGYGKSGHHSKSGHGHYGSNPFKHILQFKNELGLTEEQIAFIKDKKFEYEKMTIELGSAHKISHMELDRSLHSENIDENKINRIVEEMIAQKSKKMRARFEGKLQVLKKLTPEQRKIISKMYNQHN